MKARLIKHENDMAIILPDDLIKHYGLKEFYLEALEEGILIRPVDVKSSFQIKMEMARKNKNSIYMQMEIEANDPSTIAFYDNPGNII